MQTTNARRVEGCLDSERNVLLVLVKNGKLLFHTISILLYLIFTFYLYERIHC